MSSNVILKVLVGIVALVHHLAPDPAPTPALALALAAIIDTTTRDIIITEDIVDVITTDTFFGIQEIYVDVTPDVF